VTQKHSAAGYCEILYTLARNFASCRPTFTIIVKVGLQLAKLRCRFTQVVPEKRPSNGYLSLSRWHNYCVTLSRHQKG